MMMMVMMMMIMMIIIMIMIMMTVMEGLLTDFAPSDNSLILGPRKHALARHGVELSI